MSDQTDQSRSTAKLLLLLLLFILPVAGSWYLFFSTEFARVGGGVEHGDLIEPPRQLENIQLIRIDEHSTERTSLHGKWSMLFFVDGACESSCEENLYRVRQIRLATGKEVMRVQRVAIIDEKEEQEFRENASKNYQGQLYVIKGSLGEGFSRQFHDQQSSDKADIFLIDPRGFLMMRYSSETAPPGIIKDLSRLLKISG